MKIFNKKIPKLFIGIVFTLLLLLVAVQFWEYLPYQQTAARQIKRMLQDYNLEVTSLDLLRLNKSELIIDNIHLGKNAEFKIGKLRVDYALPRINSVNLEDITTQIYQKDQSFVIAGLEDLATGGEGTANQKYFPQSMHIKNMNISSQQADWSVVAKLDADFVQKAKDHWQGKIIAPKLILASKDNTLPTLQVMTDITWLNNIISADISAYNQQKTYQLNMQLVVPLQKPNTGNISLQKMQFPWGGGIISLKKVMIPLKSTKPVQLDILLERVDLAQLFLLLGEGKVKATGSISGLLPIIYYPDGKVTLQQGTAAALSAGIISISPDLLPGENAQLQMARKTLENFHYTKLNISVSSNQQNKSTIQLKLEGKNPDAFEGRLVNLNVNLTGDILSLIQQSILPLNDFKKILQLKGNP